MLRQPGQGEHGPHSTASRAEQVCLDGHPPGGHVHHRDPSRGAVTGEVGRRVLIPLSGTSRCMNCGGTVPHHITRERVTQEQGAGGAGRVGQLGALLSAALLKALSALCLFGLELLGQTWFSFCPSGHTALRKLHHKAGHIPSPLPEQRVRSYSARDSLNTRRQGRASAIAPSPPRLSAGISGLWA